VEILWLGEFGVYLLTRKILLFLFIFLDKGVSGILTALETIITRSLSAWR